MAGEDRPVRSLNYQQFQDAPDAIGPASLYPAIVFNTSSGPVRLLRRAEGERGFPSIDDVMALAHHCALQDWPPPHTLIVSEQTYDYLAGLLTGTIAFPKRKDR